MRPSLKRLSVACAGTLLMACVQVGRVEPPLHAMPTFAHADQAYLAGRTAHMALRLDEARAAYRAALQADPGHVNAQNGLATLYAEQGEYAKAIPMWQALTAVAPATTASAYLFSNLGYAQLLNGNHAAAVGSLERACLLDPLNYRAWHHLGSALEKLGRHERAQQMFAQASALEKHDFKIDYSLAQRSGVAAIDSAVADSYPTTELHQTESGIFELRRVAAAKVAPATATAAATETATVTTMPVAAPGDNDPAPAPQALPAALAAGREPALPPAAPADGTSLEIRNGNGVTGMARRLARKLSDASLRVTRLSNQKGFNVEHTRIEYQPGCRDAAERLAMRFGDAALVEVDTGEAAEVRLVLGRDLIHTKLEARRLIRSALARAAARHAG
ncbi:MAG TPA: LytR C-terminal domain-containing protein [Telluria sp.]|nr:LytR C-terminal domain-containing protein [Telluria sp.]